MKIVLTGGGSAGHVTPNIAIAEQLLARGDEVLYVGSRHPLEADLVQQAGLPLVQ
ncbi:MAG: glycosyltransferase, partial [Gammaproteobacteria bacterium]